MGRGLSAAIVLICLMFQPLSDPSILDNNTSFSGSKNSGIDITPVDVSITYSNLADENQYKMFSSNHPILNFNRPAELYVTDSVNSTPMDLEVTVRNEGTSTSGTTGAGTTRARTTGAGASSSGIQGSTDGQVLSKMKQLVEAMEEHRV